MFPLTAADVRELREVIRDHWTGFLAEVFGPQAAGVTEAEVRRLVAEGYLSPAAAADIDPVRDSYLLGYFRERLRQAGVDPLTASWEVARRIIAADPTPLTAVEQAAIENAKLWAGQRAVALGNRIGDQVLSAINQEDKALRARMLRLIEDETAAAIEQRTTAQALARTLARKSQDWARDWNRIAVTELQEAQEQGFADNVQRVHGAAATVAKLVNPDCCKHCDRLYNDGNGNPRIFALDELRANGDNVGRKAAEWLPVVGVTHPRCACRLVRVPEGWHFEGRELRPPGRSAE